MRAKDVPYMTTEWKTAIRTKRKYARRFYKNRTEENLRLKNKWRNEATKLRRKAIKQYWNQKAEALKSNPKEFYKTFKPFLNNKVNGAENTLINLKMNGIVEKDQMKVAGHFAHYFANMAINTGQPNIQDAN